MSSCTFGAAGSGRIGSAREPGYGLSAPPYVRGGTVCGEVVAVGSDVRDVTLGSRHLVGGLRPGSYAEYGVVDAAALHGASDGRPSPTAVPEGFTPAEAVAFNYAPVAYHTLRVAAGLSAGETVLIHAAAGGTGVLAVQLAKSFGARVVATAGGAAKVALVRELGADVVIDYRAEDFVPAVLAATGGRGVDVVWETVGGDVFTRSLECMAEGGRMDQFRVQQLQRRGPGGLLSPSGPKTCASLDGAARATPRRIPPRSWKTFSNRPRPVRCARSWRACCHWSGRRTPTA